MPELLLFISIYSILLRRLGSWLILELTVYESWQTISLVQEVPRHTYTTPPPFDKRVNSIFTMMTPYTYDQIV